MADLHNLLDDLEDREAEAALASSNDDAGVDADDAEDAAISRSDFPPAGSGVVGREAALPRLPPALAEAERSRARGRGRGGVGGDGDDYVGGKDGEGEKVDGEGGRSGGGTYNPYAAEDDDDDDADLDVVGDTDLDGEGCGGGNVADPEFEQLKSLWAQELMCPELLPHDGETMALHLELLRGQDETIDELREAAAAGGGDGGADPMLAHLAAGIYRMEADRVRFLLADLTRTRLAKIEEHALHNRELIDRMSEEEVSYLQKYGELLERHFRRSVLNHMPKETWRRLDEPEMIDRPDLDEYVFCRVLEKVKIDNRLRGDGTREGADDDDEEEHGQEIQEFLAGSCLIARYVTVRDYVLQGKVVLLM